MADRVAGPPAVPLESNAVPPRVWIRIGIRSGLAGGAVMLALLTLSARVEGLGWLHPLESIGATLVGAGAAGGAANAVGALVYAAVSAVLGVGLAAVLPDDFPPGSAATVGGSYGLFAVAVMMSLVVPAVNPAFRAAVQPVGGSWTVGCVVFGATAGLALTLRRRAAKGPLEHGTAVAGPAEPT